MAHGVRLKAPACAEATVGRPAYGIPEECHAELVQHLVLSLGEILKRSMKQVQDKVQDDRS
jgi:hypothetical protein